MTKLWVVEVQTTIVVRTEEDEGEKDATKVAKKAAADLGGWELDLSEPRPMEQIPPGWDPSCFPWGGPAGEERTIRSILKWNKEDEKAREKLLGEGAKEGQDAAALGGS